MDPIGFLIAFLVVVALGTLVGAATGLSPGLHVNNVAALMLAAHASWASFVGSLAPEMAKDPVAVGVLLACFLLATAAAHGVFDFIPSVFFGAPSEETALGILPGHRMLLAGRGSLAVALAARGAVLGALASAALLLPLRLVLSDPLHVYETFRPHTSEFLAALLFTLIAFEARGGRGRLGRIGRTALVQGLAGILGVSVLRGASGVEADAALFPLFSGLFGMPGLLAAAIDPPSTWEPQRIEPLPPLSRWEAVQAVRGSAAGAAVSWLPGLSGGAAAALATLGSRRTRPEAFMVLLGATGTATSILSVSVLFMIGRARSGVAAAVEGLLGPEATWTSFPDVPASLVLPLLAGILGAAFAAPAAVWVARAIASRWSRLDPRWLARGALALLLVLIAALTGPAGLLIAGLATLVGSVPVRVGVARVHLMASLLVPALVAVQN